MIGKIISGSSFSGTVGYVMKEKSRILEAEGIVPPDAKRMAEDFNDQTLLNPRLKNTVGHISLSFSPKDAPRMTDALMTQIAKEYMQKMGITDTTTCGGSGCANPTRPDTKSTMRSKGVCPDAPDGKGWRSNWKNRASASATSIAEIPIANKGFCSRKTVSNFPARRSTGLLALRNSTAISPACSNKPCTGLHSSETSRRRLAITVRRLQRCSAAWAAVRAKSLLHPVPAGSSTLFRCRRPVRPAGCRPNSCSASREKVPKSISHASRHCSTLRPRRWL